MFTYFTCITNLGLWTECTVWSVLSVFQSSHNTRSVAPWISNHPPTHTHNLQFGWFRNWLLCDVPWLKAPRTGPLTAHLAHLRTAPFVWPRAEKRRQEFAGFCWPVLVVAAVEPRHFCCVRTWPSKQIGGVAILASSSLLDQIPHQVKSQTSVAIFRHTRRQESSSSVTPSQFQFFWSKVRGHVAFAGPCCTAYVYFTLL